MPRKVPQISLTYTDFVLLSKKSVLICEICGTMWFWAEAHTYLPVTGRVILCEVHCGVCPKDDPIPSAQLGYRVLPVECVLLGE